MKIENTINKNERCMLVSCCVSLPLLLVQAPLSHLLTQSNNSWERILFLHPPSSSSSSSRSSSSSSSSSSSTSLSCMCIRKPELTTPTALCGAKCMATKENRDPYSVFSGSCTSHCRGLARTPNKNAFRENEKSRTSTASRREARTPSRAFGTI